MVRGHAVPLLTQVLRGGHLRVVRHYRHGVVAVKKAVLPDDVSCVLQLLVLLTKLTEVLHGVIGGTRGLVLLLGAANGALHALFHPGHERCCFRDRRGRLHKAVYDVDRTRSMSLQCAHGVVKPMCAGDLPTPLERATNPGTNLVEYVGALLQLQVRQGEKVLCLVRHGAQLS